MKRGQLPPRDLVTATFTRRAGDTLQQHGPHCSLPYRILHITSRSIVLSSTYRGIGRPAQQQSETTVLYLRRFRLPKGRGQLWLQPYPQRRPPAVPRNQKSAMREDTASPPWRDVCIDLRSSQARCTDNAVTFTLGKLDAGMVSSSRPWALTLGNPTRAQCASPRVPIFAPSNPCEWTAPSRPWINPHYHCFSRSPSGTTSSGGFWGLAIANPVRLLRLSLRSGTKTPKRDSNQYLRRMGGIRAR